MNVITGRAHIPCSLPISESSDSLSPEVVMPTAPATELDASQQKEKMSKEATTFNKKCLDDIKILSLCY